MAGGAHRDGTGRPAKCLALVVRAQDCRATLQTVLLPAVVGAQHVSLLSPFSCRQRCRGPLLGDAGGARLEDVLDAAGTAGHHQINPEAARRRHRILALQPDRLQRHGRRPHHRRTAVRGRQRMPRGGHTVQGQRPVACEWIHGAGATRHRHWCRLARPATITHPRPLCNPPFSIKPNPLGAPECLPLILVQNGSSSSQARRAGRAT